MTRNYDIWAIQHEPQQVYHAIEGLERTRTNLLFSNLKSFLKLGDDVLPIQFDTALFSEAERRLILLLRDGKLTPEEFRDILNEKNIPFHEVTFMKNVPTEQEELKELWFAIDKFVIDEALHDSKSKGIDVCDYYPDLRGCLELRYLSNEGDCVTIHKQLIHGAVLLEDKLVLLMNKTYNKGIEFQEVLSSFYESNMTPRMVVGESELPKEQLPKQYKKEQ